jgi:hypothetical protein
MPVGGRLSVTQVSDKEVKFYLVFFVVIWIFLLGVLPWLAWKPTDSALSIGIRATLSILSTPIGYLCGWRWGFCPIGRIQRGKVQETEQVPS